MKEETVLTITPTTTFPQDGQVVPGSVYAFGPDGITFERPVKMTISYAQGQVPSGIAEPDLRIHKVSGAGRTLAVEGAVDLAAHAASASVGGPRLLDRRRHAGALSRYRGQADAAGRRRGRDADVAAPERELSGHLGLRHRGEHDVLLDGVAIESSPAARGASDLVHRSGAGIVRRDLLRAARAVRDDARQRS